MAWNGGAQLDMAEDPGVVTGRLAKLGCLLIVVFFLSLGLPFGMLAGPASAHDAGWQEAIPVSMDGGLTGAGDADNPKLTMDALGNAIALWSQDSRVWANRLSKGSNWATPVLLETREGTTANASVVTDSYGNAIAIWEYDQGARSVIRASHYSISSGWSPAEVIGRSRSGPSLRDAIGPQIDISPTGDATVVWKGWNFTGWTIWSNHFVVGSGWGSYVQVQTNSVRVQGLGVAVDPTGDAITVWQQRNGTGQDDVWASYFTTGLGWSSPTQISTMSGNASTPLLSMDDSGNAIVVWGQESRVWARRYVADAGWDAPASISEGGGTKLRTAMDSGGNVTVVWIEGGRILANRFVAGSGWGNATVIGTFTSSSYPLPEVATDRTGGAFVVWDVDEFPDPGRIMASRYVTGEGWKSPAKIGTGSADGHHLVVDSEGNAIVVWNQYYSYGREWEPEIWANRFMPGVGWGNQTPLDPGLGKAGSSQVAVEPEGHAVVVWRQSHGPRSSIWSNAFEVDEGWGTAKRAEPGWSGAQSPQVVPYGEDNAITLWSQGNGFDSAIWARRYVNDRWEVATPIESGPGDSFAPRIDVDSLGNAIAVWERLGADRSIIRSARYSTEGEWDLPIQVSAGGGNAFSPQVAVTPAGKATVVWLERNGAEADVWANHFTIGGGWGSPTQIETMPGNAFSPRLAADDFGNAIVVWGQDPDQFGYFQRVSVWASRYVPGEGWGSPSQIAADISIIRPNIEIALGGDGAAMVWSGGYWTRFLPEVGWERPTKFERKTGMARVNLAMDAQGDAVMIWHGCSWYGGRRCVEASRHTSGAGWEDPIRLGPQRVSGYVQGSPQVAVNPAGRAVAVWQIRDVLWANLYDDGGWRPAAAIDGGVLGGSSSDVQVAMDSVGNAIVVRSQGDGSNSRIWTNRYTRGSVMVDLKITAPTVALTNNSLVMVSGRTHPGATVTVNGIFTPVDALGGFNYTEILPDGAHTFLVVARDSEGNLNTRTVTITVDTVAPLLVFEQPVDGMTTDIPTVDVTGMTEPGGELAVNGVSVVVGSDGSFTVRLPLAEGVNTITAKVTDLAGNAATGSLNVTYVIPPGPGFGFIEYVAFGAIASVSALVVVLALLEVRRRRAIGLADSPQPSMEVESNGTGENHWPTRSGPVHLTAKERILLHLQHFARYSDAPQAPPELTQSRIAEAAGIERKHFAQYVRPLVGDQLVEERTTRVRGTVQKRKVYDLTEEGRRSAIEVGDRIRSGLVRVRDDAGVKEITIAEALLETRGSMSTLDILREWLEAGVVDLRRQ